MCVRVLIADNQPRARRSLRALLTAMRWSTPSHTQESTPAGLLPIEIVGEAETGEEAMEQVRVLLPDVVVMDLHLQAAPDSDLWPDGIATIRMIKSRWPDIRIVVLTMYAVDRALALESGADAFLLKGCPTGELLEALMPGLGAN